MKKIYEGSVKNLWAGGDGTLDFEFTDAYSVFDWGRMPDELNGKGEALARIGEFIFRQLGERKKWQAFAASTTWAQTLEYYRNLDASFAVMLEHELGFLMKYGMQNHFIQRKQSNRLTVRQVTVIKPRLHQFAGRDIYDYGLFEDADAELVLIPLETIFRFGAPEGSSFFERATDDYCRQLGLGSTKVQPGSRFPAAIVEFFSKLENKDRFLTFEQALNYSRLDYVDFQSVIALTILTASILKEHFESRDLELWDGKFEWALDRSGSRTRIMLVDSVGPDELRLIDKGTGIQISKEFLRSYYRKTDWFQAMQDEKKSGGDWKNRVIKKAGQPPVLSIQYKTVAQNIYPTLAQWTTADAADIAVSPQVNELREAMKQCR